MPCYSTITQTKILDVNRLMQALKDVKIQAEKVSDLLVRTAIGNFSRSHKGEAFVFDGQNLGIVGKQYAMLSARSFAQKKGLGIQAQTQKQIVLVKR